MRPGDSSTSILARALSLARAIRRDGQGVYLLLHGEQRKAWVGRPGRVLHLPEGNQTHCPSSVGGQEEPIERAWFESLRNHLDSRAFFLLGPHLMEHSQAESGLKGVVILPDLEIELDEENARVTAGSPGSLLDYVEPQMDLPGHLPITDGWAAWESETESAFLKRVERAVSLTRGRSGKIILTRRFSRMPPHGKDPLDLAALLLGAEPGAAVAHFLQLPGGMASMGTGPENVFEVLHDRLVMDVVAGSRPVAKGRQDSDWESELLASEKEGREHGMALDRALAFAEGLCEPGTVGQVFSRRVRQLRRIRHLHSRVGGTFKKGLSGLDAMAASYPPLISYPEDLRESNWLGEVPPRFYGGMVGRWVSPTECSVFLNLRALEIDGERLYTRSGAGIVDGADASSECAEIMLKLGSVLDAVEAWLV